MIFQFNVPPPSPVLTPKDLALPLAYGTVRAPGILVERSSLEEIPDGTPRSMWMPTFQVLEDWVPSTNYSIDPRAYSGVRKVVNVNGYAWRLKTISNPGYTWGLSGASWPADPTGSAQEVVDNQCTWTNLGPLFSTEKKNMVVWERGDQKAGYAWQAVYAIAEGPISSVRAIYTKDDVRLDDWTTIAADVIPAKTVYNLIEPLADFSGYKTTYTLSVGSVPSITTILSDPAGTWQPWVNSGGNLMDYQMQGVAAVRFYGLTSEPAGDSNGSPPDLSFEVSGINATYGTEGLDAHPRDVLIDLLTKAGFASADIITDVGNDGTAASSFKNYVEAQGFYVSRLIDGKTEAAALVEELMLACNSTLVWMEDGKVKAVPLGDTAIAAAALFPGAPAFTPVTTAYVIDEDEILWEEGQDPVSVKRVPDADIYSAHPISFFCRSADYVEQTVEWNNPPMAATKGTIRAETTSSPWITNIKHAHAISELIGKRNYYQRNTFTFKLPPRWSRLEPTDLIALTHTWLGLSDITCRVVSVEQDEQGILTVEAIEKPLGVSTPLDITPASPTPTVPGLPDGTPMPIDYAFSDLAIIGSDGYLTRAEKPRVIIDYNTAVADYTTLHTKATTLGIAHANFTTYYDALVAYMASLSPAYTDTTTNTMIDATTWRSVWENYRTERTKVADAITANAQTDADASTAAIGEMTADGIITPAESQAFVDAVTKINRDWYFNFNNANGKVNTTIWSNYSTAISDFASFLSSFLGFTFTWVNDGASTTDKNALYAWKMDSHQILDGSQAGGEYLRDKFGTVYKTQAAVQADLTTTTAAVMKVLATPGGTSTFLRADGTFATPPSAGSGVTSIATTAPITGGTITSTGTIGISAATTSAAGSMSAADKTKLDTLESASVSGNRWGVTPQIGSDGVMEVGKFFDFHETDSDTGDYSIRLSSQGNIFYVSSSTIVGGNVGIYSAGVDGAMGDVMFIGNAAYPTTYRNKIQSSISGTPSNSRIIFSLSTGASSYANVLTLLGNGDVTVLGNMTAYSDARLKTDVETISGALAKTLALRGVNYTRKSDGSRQMGLIAQEVMEIAPEVVQMDANGVYSVAYGNLVGLLIEAIKGLNAKVEELKARVK